MRAVSPIRRCRPGVIAAAACWLVAIGHAQEAGPAIDQEMKASLRGSFSYQGTAKAEPAPLKMDPALILLPRVIVRSRWEAEGLDGAIAHQESLDDKFTLYKGGTLSSNTNGRLRNAVGVWYDDDHPDRNIPNGAVPGLNLLKFSW
jgi:hypothetical protein